MTSSYKELLLFLMLIAPPGGCESDSSGRRAPPDVSEPHAVSDSGEERPSDTYDTLNGNSDAHGADEDGTNSDSGDAPPFFDFSPWRVSNSCDGPVPARREERQFRIPDRPPPEYDAPSKSAFESSFEINPQQILTSARVPPRFEPGENAPLDAYVKKDDPFVIQLGAKRLAGHYQNRQIFVTVMVDYEPVAFRLRELSEDRSKVLDESVQTHAMVPFSNPLEIFDVVIPASAFSRKGYHDLGLLTRIKDPKNGKSFTYFRRIGVFRGSYDRPSHPCFEPPLRDKPNQAERTLQGTVRGFLQRGIGIIRADIQPSERERIKIPEYTVEPGETVPINMSIGDKPYRQGDTLPMVLVPFLNGKPLKQRWYIQAGAKEPNRLVVDGRKHFKVQLPQEPGTYDLFVGGWFRPYEFPRDLETGEPKYRLATINHNMFSTIIRFHVETTENR